jgi:hypothetical protein
MLSAGTYRGRLGDMLYATELPRAGEVVGLSALPRTEYPFQTLQLGQTPEMIAYADSMREFYAQPAIQAIRYVGQIVGTSLGAFHGYRRTGGKMWPAIGWALMGGIFWPIVIPVIVAQGPGKRKGR